MAMACHFLFMLYQVLAVCGDYELRVTIHSFRNPGGTCANSYCNDTRCCDYGLKPCPNPCDYYFSLCVRPAGTPVSSVRLINRGHCVTYDTDVSPHISNGKTFTDVVFGNTPNPIKFTGTQWPVNGAQLFVEILDFDPRSTPELIDRFASDITTPVGSTSGRKIYPGIFRLAEVEFTSELECADNFYGSSCDIFCLENCTINHCAGVNCGQNQRCVDGVLNYTCVCDPGYTGPDCSTEFDVCTGVNCNEGSCVEGVGSCVCDPGYTGQFCERRLDGYELQVTIHSFSNPNGMCANSYCGPQSCCEIDQGTSCPPLLAEYDK